MKTDEGIYLTHVLNGTRSGRCHLIRPLHLHYLMTTWYLQYTSSGNRTIGNFALTGKFKNVRLPELTPVWILRSRHFSFCETCTIIQPRKRLRAHINHPTGTPDVLAFFGDTP
jgi:hypothetical protein